MNQETQYEKIRVLVVDDSVLMGRQISRILSDDEQIEVVGRAKDGIDALEKLEQLKPDVITLDVEMPRMNGITALKHIMVKHAIPTVMISALTQEGARTTFDALKYGAIDVIAKPSRRQDVSLEAQAHDIVTKVKKAAAIRMGRSRYVRIASTEPIAKSSGHGPVNSNTPLVAIGTGTGGYYSLLRIVPGLKADFPGTLVAMVLAAPRFLKPFISYLDEHSVIPVKYIREAGVPEKGCCYLASSHDGLSLKKQDDGTIAFQFRDEPSDELEDGAIDRFFKSVSEQIGRRAVGIVLSGPGADGADGIVDIREAGGMGIVQDINNCMHPSMPLAVLQAGSVERILPDYDMAAFLNEEDGLNVG